MNSHAEFLQVAIWYVKVLDLASNNLTGRVDELLMRLSILKEFRVNNNQLTGSMPMDFASTHIEVCQLACSHEETGNLKSFLGVRSV